MKKFASLFLNFIFFSIVILLAFVIATIALTKKVNEYAHRYNQSIKGTVIKETIPVLSSGSGIVKKIYVQTGQVVKKDDMLIELDNQVLQNKIDVLKQYTDNVSAQTEAQIAEQELGNLKITAPTDGMIGDITVTEGTPVEITNKLLTLYSNKNIRLLAGLTVDEYQAIKNMQQIQAYDERLNQSFYIIPDILNPNENTATDVSTSITEKKIGLFFKFQDPNDALSLLNDEDLTLELNTQNQKINKPIDYFVNFWNQLLSK